METWEWKQTGNADTLCEAEFDQSESSKQEIVVHV